ncbi:MAG: hypothetical protein MUF38_12855 [Anaerolineae bacterium]|jgi:hypothetical protein|nr:hypothetical protein [Anaerolineae bacterium]
MNAIDKIVRYILLTVLWGGAFVMGGIMQTQNPWSVVLVITLFVMGAIFSKQATWPIKSNIDKLARYGFLASLWFVTFLFTMFVSSAPAAIFSGYYLSSSYFSLVWLVVLITAAITSVVMFPRYDQKQSVTPASVTTKRKNNQPREPVDPLDLLTDDDLAELRQEIKDEIRARLRYGSNDELVSLEDLIDDHRSPVSAKRKS